MRMKVKLQKFLKIKMHYFIPAQMTIMPSDRLTSILWFFVYVSHPSYTSGNMWRNPVPIRTPPPKHKRPERISRAIGDRASPVEEGVHFNHFTIAIGIIPQTMDTSPRTDLCRIKISHKNNYFLKTLLLSWLTLSQLWLQLDSYCTNFKLVLQ